MKFSEKKRSLLRDWSKIHGEIVPIATAIRSCENYHFKGRKAAENRLCDLKEKRASINKSLNGA